MKYKVLMFFKAIYFKIILFGCGTKIPKPFSFISVPQNSFQVETYEKLQYLAKLILTFTPLAYLLNIFNAWFPSNQVFFQVLVWTLLANVIVGAKVHWGSNTFKLKTLLLKNIEMCIIILLVYPILGGINQITGDNIAGNVFQWAIQIGTILYPGSKVLKNVHIWSNGKYPPKFIMEKIYKFEKDGDIKDLLNKEE